VSIGNKLDMINIVHELFVSRLNFESAKLFFGRTQVQPDAEVVDGTTSCNGEAEVVDGTARPSQDLVGDEDDTASGSEEWRRSRRQGRGFVRVRWFTGKIWSLGWFGGMVGVAAAASGSAGGGWLLRRRKKPEVEDKQ
jgi:hypothetical protein